MITRLKVGLKPDLTIETTDWGVKLTQGETFQSVTLLSSIAIRLAGTMRKLLANAPHKSRQVEEGHATTLEVLSTGAWDYLSKTPGSFRIRGLSGLAEVAQCLEDTAAEWSRLKKLEGKTDA